MARTSRLAGGKLHVLARVAFGCAMVCALSQTTAALAQTATDAATVADKLREGHVVRTLQACRQRGQSDDNCKAELEALLKRDQSALARIGAYSDLVEKTELIVAAARCYDPSFDYTQLIACRESIADQLEAVHGPVQLAQPEPATSTPPTDAETVASDRTSVSNVQSAEVSDGLPAVPSRRPRRITDIDWAAVLNSSSADAENLLSDLATCETNPLRVTLPAIGPDTKVKENFWRPVVGDLASSGGDTDEGSGLRILACRFGSIARANLLFHEVDDQIFRIDVIFQVSRCNEPDETACLEVALSERMHDLEMFSVPGDQIVYSAFGDVEKADERYEDRYSDLLVDDDGRRRLNWANCAKLNDKLQSFVSDAGMVQRCVVDAKSGNDTWEAISFLEIANPTDDRADTSKRLTSRITLANEPLEQVYLDRHSLYFQTLVKGRLASATVAQTENGGGQLLQQVTSQSGLGTTPDNAIDAGTVGTAGQGERERMRSILRKLVGLSP